MEESSSQDTASFADELAAMTDEELFASMRTLEQESESGSQAKHDISDVLARIALVEETIEDRYPGQALAPYKRWQKLA